MKEGVDIRARASQLGWSTDKNALDRVKWKLDVFLKRTRHCFMALTEKELAAYLEQHEHVAHLDPTKRRDRIAQKLIDLRLPPPRLSRKPSKSFCRRLYEMMTK